MNKVITINLNGSAFQLEEAAYDALRTYLDNAGRQLAANPDKDEIIADIEQAIGDKCRGVLSPHKNVVLTREIEEIIAAMGPVDGGSAADPSAKTGTPPNSAAGAAGATDSASAGPAPAANVRRLYRIHEGAMIAGVCNGLAAYFGIDPTLVRVLFVLFSFITVGGMAVGYLILALLLPSASTPEEKAAAQGLPATAQEFIRRAREGYYQAAKTWGDKRAHREWKRKFKHDMRTWRQQFRQSMRSSSAGWGPSWQSGATATPPPPAPPPHPDWSLWAVAPFAAILKTALTLLAFFAIFSLIASGKFFTFALPAGVPVWVAIVVVVIVYQILAAPFHALRHACRYGGAWPHPLAALLSLFCSVLGLLLLVFTVWYLNRHVPEAHEFFRKIPPALHALLDALRAWWASL